MSTWTVTNRLTGEVVYAYDSDAPIEWPGMEFISFNHAKPPTPPALPPTVPRRVSKQQFLDRLGSVAVGFILTAAKTEVSVEAWVKRLDLTTPDPDGTSIDLDDSRTITGVTELGALMASQGIVVPEWAAGVLSG